MSDIEDAFATGEELREIRKENDHSYIPSSFKFINAHKGLRPGGLHILLGTSGSGKSTLARAIIMDAAEEHEVLVWLSEEDREDFVTAIAKNYPKPETARNIKIVSELNLDEKYTSSPQALFHKYSEIVKSLNPKVVLFDNITTSRMYMGLRPGEQDQMAWKLKELHANTDIPSLIVAHTKSDVTDTSPRLIEDTDIRGSKSITNLVPYLYIFQRFELDSFFYPTIRLRKTRKHQVDNRLFLVTYSREKNTYVGDRELAFKDFKEAFNKRNKL